MNHYALADVSRELQRAGCGIVSYIQKPTQPQTNNIPSSIARKCKNIDATMAILSTAEEHGVSLDDIFGRSRKKKVVDARYEAIRAVARAVDWKRSCGNWADGFWSTKAIGLLFDRDHTTICYALGTLTSKMSKRGAVVGE